MKAVAHASKLVWIVIVLVGVLALASGASAAQPTANQLLLNDGSGSSSLAPTSTTVLTNRFNPASASFFTGVTDVEFAVGTSRTDVQVSNTIARPLRMQRSGVEWNEYNLLISGLGFSRTALYGYGVQQGKGRYLNVRVMVPDDWNGRLFFWHHGSADTQLLMYTPVVEPELLLARGWAVVEAQFNGPAPAQQNPNASDDSYWKSVDEMFNLDSVNYWSYAAHPSWWSNPNGVAISDGATLRNLAGLVKNLLYVEEGRQPRHSYWFGWSAGGPAGTAVDTGRDQYGNYTGGDFVVPYDRSSGKVFDGFMALEPVNSATAPVDPQFPVAAPYVFLDGQDSPLSLEWPNALNVAHKVQLALAGPGADPSLSKNVNDWVHLYTEQYGDHDWTGRFFTTVNSGPDKDAVYYDISKPWGQRFNTTGQGRQLNWVMTKLYWNSPTYLTDWFDQSMAGWGQGTSAYYLLDDGYHTALFNDLVDSVEHRAQMPESRIDPYLLGPSVTTYPNLPTNDPAQDSLYPASGTTPTPLNPTQAADLAWQQTSPDALAAEAATVPMPYFTARWGIFSVGYKWQVITPFTPEQLVSGYHVGNIDFNGYANQRAFDKAFKNAIHGLLLARMYDPQIAARFASGDPAGPTLSFPH